MRNELVAPCDGAALARGIRSVAAQASRTLKRPANPADSREILAAIAHLERDARSRSSEPLTRWLASLRRCIEVHSARMA